MQRMKRKLQKKVQFQKLTFYKKGFKFYSNHQKKQSKNRI